MDEQETEGNVDIDAILREARQTQLSLNVTADYKVYICICAIFGAQRKIHKSWNSYQAVFTKLIAADEENGQKHFFQSVIQFFINRNPDQQKFAAALCKTLYDNSVLDDEFFTQWHSKQLKLDRDSKLYDRPAESAMRPLLNEFVQWLQSAEYDDEEGYGEEEETKGDGAEENAPSETDA